MVEGVKGGCDIFLNHFLNAVKFGLNRLVLRFKPFSIHFHDFVLLL